MSRSGRCYPAKHDPVKGWYITGSDLGEHGAANLGVYRACRDKDCEHVIKIGTTAKIEKEINMQNECAKHNLCKPVEDWWRCDYGKIAFVMPILDQTLKKKLSTIGSSNEESLKLIKEDLYLIWKLHQVGIVHRDLTLGNFMIDTSGTLLLIDFGESEFMPRDNEKAASLISDDYGTFGAWLPPFMEVVGGLIGNISTAIFRMRNKYPAEEAERIVLEKVVALNIEDLNNPTEVTKLIKSIRQLYEPPVPDPGPLVLAEAVDLFPMFPPSPAPVPPSPAPVPPSPVTLLPVAGSGEKEPVESGRIKSDLPSYHRMLLIYVMGKKHISEGKSKYIIDLCVNRVAFDLNITNGDVRNAIYNKEYMKSLHKA